MGPKGPYSVRLLAGPSSRSGWSPTGRPGQRVGQEKTILCCNVPGTKDLTANAVPAWLRSRIGQHRSVAVLAALCER
jgi:hypothetical protein